MCGIWAFASVDENLQLNQIRDMVRELFVLSETRGKEASGIASVGTEKVNIYKAAIPGSELVRTEGFDTFWNNNVVQTEKKQIAFVGHSRLVTNGSELEGDNNQPVFDKEAITVHNGIIVNVEELWNRHPEIRREHAVDTEIFVKLLEAYINQGIGVEDAVKRVYEDIRGMASTLTLLPARNLMVAASNNGSLYMMRSKNRKSVVFASERIILRKWITRSRGSDYFDEKKIVQVKAGTAAYVDMNTCGVVGGTFGNRTNINHNIGIIKEFPIICEYYEKKRMRKKNSVSILNESRLIRYDIDLEPIKNLRRCTKCILPETMPFIEFDEEGVCNYCRTYQKQQYHGEEKLRQWAEGLSENQNGLDSVVSFSGGRDSSFGLHYFVKELGLKPIAYSYDWGMVTDLARRNQSRMCAQLGIELIVVSANIRKKRENIRKNVSAWLKKPDLGMIPLFMAGDKQYFYYANKVQKDYHLDTVLLASNPFEKTYFKSGYCGVKPEILRLGEEKRAMERLPIGSIARMASHYLGQYATNPAYINSSVVDTALATMSYYVIPHNYFLLFDYIPWNESQVNDILINEYDWETAKDSKSTWRIGDGTSPFYNYVYYSVTGFSENDTLRSNQIREGMLNREEALELAFQDNQPRFDSIKWYFDTIGLSMYDALEVVSKMKKLY